MLYTSVEQLIGGTPLLELTHMEKKLALGARLLAKLEMFNPGGSAKDRIALNMLDDAEKRGALRPGSVIIEPTSGNTGIGLAMVGAARGYRVVIVMIEGYAREKMVLIRGLGGEVVLVPHGSGIPGARAKVEELLAARPGAVPMRQDARQGTGTDP